MKHGHSYEPGLRSVIKPGQRFGRNLRARPRGRNETRADHASCIVLIR